MVSLSNHGWPSPFALRQAQGERSVPVPLPRAGKVLVRVKAFGLNRSELFTRQGPPGVTLMKVIRALGLELKGAAAKG